MKLFYRPKLEIADIFKSYGHLLGKMPLEHWKVIQDIKNCRTRILGGHKLKCNSCEFEKHSYNSCRNRHCTKCQYLPQVKWIEKRKEDLLPCQYFHVVFTIPSELRPLILRNKKISYNILFKAASQTLKEVALKQLGAEIGCIGVLHTWSQNLIDHPHIHFIVPGGGLDQKRKKWIKCKQNFLLPVEVLSEVFRGKMIDYVEQNFEKLEFKGQIEYLKIFGNFKELLFKCASKDWVVYSKETFLGPEQVINYLGQYTHRIAISNFRLVKLEDGKVYFKVRSSPGSEEMKVISLSVKEFMRRFLLHVLPKRYIRIRHFGLFGSRYKKIKIAIIRKLENIIIKVNDVASESWKDLLERTKGIKADQCPKCQKGKLIDIRMIPSLLNSS